VTSATAIGTRLVRVHVLARADPPAEARPGSGKDKHVPTSRPSKLRFADGSHTSIKPTDGFILYALTRSQNARGGLTEAIAHNAAGKDVGHETFKPTRR